MNLAFEGFGFEALLAGQKDTDTSRFRCDCTSPALLGWDVTHFFTLSVNPSPESLQGEHVVNHGVPRGKMLFGERSAKAPDVHKLKRKRS